MINLSLGNPSLGKKASSSSEIAKERLKLVLIYDRIKITPQLMEALKGDIIAAISRHLEVDQTAAVVTITHGDRCDRLVAEIPVRRVRSSSKTY